MTGAVDTPERTLLVAGAFGAGDLEQDAVVDAFAYGLPRMHCVVTAHQPATLRASAPVPTIAASDVARLRRIVENVDGVCLTGDEVFASTRRGSWFGRIHRAAALTLFAKRSQRPVSIVGPRVVTIENGRDRFAARFMVRAADLTIVNDEPSAAILATAGAPVPMRVGTDPTWVLAGAPRPAVSRRDELVVVVDARIGGPWMEERIGGALRQLEGRLERIVIEPWGSGAGRFDDRPLARSLYDHLDGIAEVVDPPADFREAIERYAGARGVVTLRRRAIVAASAAGTPSLAIVDNARDLAIPLGVGQPALSADATTEEVHHAIEELLDRDPPTRGVVEHHVALAREAFRLLGIVMGVDDGDGEEIARLDLRPVPWRR